MDIETHAASRISGVSLLPPDVKIHSKLVAPLLVGQQRNLLR